MNESVQRSVDRCEASDCYNIIITVDKGLVNPFLKQVHGESRPRLLMVGTSPLYDGLLAIIIQSIMITQKEVIFFDDLKLLFYFRMTGYDA